MNLFLLVTTLAVIKNNVQQKVSIVMVDATIGDNIKNP